jgi:hypothetical protein
MGSTLNFDQDGRYCSRKGRLPRRMKLQLFFCRSLLRAPFSWPRASKRQTDSPSHRSATTTLRRMALVFGINRGHRIAFLFLPLAICHTVSAFCEAYHNERGA